MCWLCATLNTIFHWHYIEAGTSKISLTILGTSDTHSFRDAFNDGIIFTASFIQNFINNMIQGFQLALLSKPLLKTEDNRLSLWANHFHTSLIKEVFLLSEEFQCNLSAKISYEYSWQLYQLFDKKISGSVSQV